MFFIFYFSSEENEFLPHFPQSPKLGSFNNTTHNMIHSSIRIHSFFSSFIRAHFLFHNNLVFSFLFLKALM